MLVVRWKAPFLADTQKLLSSYGYLRTRPNYMGRRFNDAYRPERVGAMYSVPVPFRDLEGEAADVHVGEAIVTKWFGEERAPGHYGCGIGELWRHQFAKELAGGVSHWDLVRRQIAKAACEMMRIQGVEASTVNAVRRDLRGRGSFLLSEFSKFVGLLLEGSGVEEVSNLEVRGGGG